VAKYTTSTGAQCKFLRIYRISKYFINEKICGPGPWRYEPAAQPGPWWTSGRCRQEGPEARRCACRSRASSQYGAWELTGGGGKERGEHRGPFAGLTEARVAVLQSGIGDEAAVGALKLRGRVKRGGERVVRSGGAHLLLLGSEESWDGGNGQ
jgi:hypothetical protein